MELENLIKMYSILEDEKYRNKKEIEEAVTEKTLEIIEELTRKNDSKLLIELYNNSEKIENQIIDMLKIKMMREKEKEKKEKEEYRKRKEMQLIAEKELKRIEEERRKNVIVVSSILTIIIMFIPVIIAIITY